MSQWPTTWRIDQPDLAYGQRLLEELTPFVTRLISVEKLSASSIRRHLESLFLLGGELISRINIFEEDRRLSPAKLRDQSISEDGGPLCRHVAAVHLSPFANLFTRSAAAMHRCGRQPTNTGEDPKI
jgi:hypothetical protein